MEKIDMQLSSSNKTSTQSNAVQNLAGIHVFPYQKSSVGLTVLEGQMKYLSIEINGEWIFKKAPLEVNSDIQIYVYMKDGEIRWKQVEANLEWESPEDCIYLKTRS